jgi:hypothetical protein
MLLIERFIKVDFFLSHYMFDQGWQRAERAERRAGFDEPSRAEPFSARERRAE